jgi:hypothetical protein
MDEQYVTRIIIQQHRPPLLYSEREAATVSHMSIGAIRHLRSMGLIGGEETGFH